MKKILRRFAFLSLLVLAVLLTACTDFPDDSLVQESWEDYLTRHGETQKYYLEADYDGDGQTEAYAVTGTGFDYEGRTLNAKVYFISSTGRITCVLDKAPDGGTLCGWLENNTDLRFDPDAAYIKEGNRKFIVWELDVRDGVNGSRILGVKNGLPYEPKISGEYNRFWPSNDGSCAAYKGNDNFVYYFRFNASTYEYDLTKKVNSLTGETVWKK